MVRAETSKAGPSHSQQRSSFTQWDTGSHIGLLGRCGADGPGKFS